jgi:predicted metal-dependent phosphoesterase TrpH
VLVDLHTHTTASDGLFEPPELLRRAGERGLSAIGITDHDTAAGVRGALAAARPAGLEVVAGIEVSAYVGERELHVLGYFIDPEHESLRRFEEERKRLRTERLHRIVAQLRAAGMEITVEDVLAQPGGDGAPGRPHVARTLVAKGYATSMSDCFNRIFARTGPGHVPVEKPEAAEAAALIEGAGGVPVIAHAALDKLDPVLDELVAKGMRGIEVWHPDHDAAARERYDAYARARGLVRTGGSDYHGEGRKDGGTLGGTACPGDCLEALRRAARS